MREAIQFYKHRHNWSNRMMAGGQPAACCTLQVKREMCNKAYGNDYPVWELESIVDFWRRISQHIKMRLGATISLKLTVWFWTFPGSNYSLVLLPQITRISRTYSVYCAAKHARGFAAHHEMHESKISRGRL